MEQKIVNIKLTALILIIFGLALTRLVPHPDNFTPIAAIALFGGAYFDRRALAFLVPLAAMLASDVFLGLHDLLWAVYGAFVVIVVMGFALRRFERKMPYWIAMMALLASSWFFVATNFAVWLTSGLYPQTLEGLILCYIAAIPFFGHQLAGDLFYTGLLFGGWHLACRTFPALAASRA